MESDEEEMASMRSSTRYGGGRKVAQEVPQHPAGAANGDSSEDERAGIRQRAPGDTASRRPGASDDEDAVSVDLAAPEAEGQRSLLPVSFGKQKPQRKAGRDPHEAARRSDAGDGGAPRAPAPGGVHFGPRSFATVARRARRAAEPPAGAAAPGSAAPASPPGGALPSAPPGGGLGRGAEVEAEDGPEEEADGLPLTHEAVIPAHEKPVTAMGLDPKASRMVTGSMDGTIKFFDFNGMSEEKSAFRCLEPVEGHMVQAVSFGTTGGCLLVVCSDSHARIYDRDGSSKPIQSTVKGDMYVRDMAHTKGHTQMLTGGMWHPFHAEHWLTSSLDGTLRLWDINATPVGMDQVLPSVHVLKTLDKRNVCVGGGSGRLGGLYPCCCAFSPTDAKKIVGGCSDGSVQLFFEKTRYQRPDKILRSAHSGPVSDVAFLCEGGRSDLMVTRSLDDTVKVWDCRMLSDERGPLRALGGLAAGHEKAGVCTSPDGRYIAVAAALDKKAAGGAASVRVFDAKDFSLRKSLAFGKRSGIRLAWPKELNQLLVTSTAGEVVVLYSPSLSQKGALHFVGRRAKSRPAGPAGGDDAGPIFNMTDQDDIKRFYSTGHGNMTKIRRQEARHSQKTLKPYMPPGTGNDQANSAQSDSAAFAALALKMGAQRLNFRSTTGVDPDSQRALLAYAPKIEAEGGLLDKAYSKTQPDKLLDWSTEQSEGDKRMQDRLKGDFCRKCGQKVCRCVDYSRWGNANKKPRTS